MSRCDVLIVGGGISGLSLAWWLAEAGLAVEIWEADDRIGGKIRSTQQGGYLTERAASMLMNFRPEVEQLIHQAGLGDIKTPRTRTAEAHRYLLQKDQLRALPLQLGAMLLSPIWSLRGKLRLLAEPFIPAGTHEHETVSQFIKRRLGQEMLEKAMEPFVAGTLAADPDQVSASATLPRLTALERRYGSITAGILIHKLFHRRTACATDTFSFRGGMGVLADTLSRHPGIRLRAGHRVAELTRGPQGWQVTATTANGQRTRHVHQVVLATPAPVAGNLTAPLDAELAELLQGIPYSPVTVVHMGMDQNSVGHPLDGAGFLTPRAAKVPLTGNLWMSSLFHGRVPSGKVLLSSYLGGARSPHVRDWNNEKALAETLRTLRPLLKLKSDPEMVRIDRHERALPLYHGAYQVRLRAIANRLQRLPGLYLEANYRGGVSVRDRIACGHRAAHQILSRTMSDARSHTAEALPETL